MKNTNLFANCTNYNHLSDSEIIANVNAMDSNERKNYILYSITNPSNGKVEGIRSISTSCLCTESCIKRHGISKKLVEFKKANPDSDFCLGLCAFCYAWNQLNRYKNLKAKCERNYVFYNSIELNYDDIPYINDNVFRFEGFGEQASATQFKNDLAITEKNAQTTFTLWTKNLKIIIDEFKTRTKPTNLRLIASYPLLDGVNFGKYIDAISKLTDCAGNRIFDGIFIVVSDNDDMSTYHDTEQVRFVKCIKKCMDCNFTCYHNTDDNRMLVLIEKKK